MLVVLCYSINGEDEKKTFGYLHIRFTFVHDRLYNVTCSWVPLFKLVSHVNATHAKLSMKRDSSEQRSLYLLTEDHVYINISSLRKSFEIFLLVFLSFVSLFQ